MNKAKTLNALLKEIRTRQLNDFIDYMYAIPKDVIKNRLSLCFYTKGKLNFWEKFALALTSFDPKDLDYIKSESLKSRKQSAGEGQNLQPYYFLTANEYEKMLSCFE
jgi:hypothetical protein